jgi:PleD family two-component response regulator
MSAIISAGIHADPRSFDQCGFSNDIPDAEYTPRVHEAMMSMTLEIRTLRQRLEDMEKSADLDPLLPVLNRRAFMRALRRQISTSVRYKSRAALVYLDLDGFKDVNDCFGHACGDATLVHFAEVLRKNVREGDLIGRLGGDEFGIVPATLVKISGSARQSRYWGF